jgi:hypothetical protein
MTRRDGNSRMPVDMEPSRAQIVSGRSWIASPIL